MRILVTGSEGFIGGHVTKLIGDCDRIDLKLGSDIRTQLPNEPYTHVIHLAALKSVELSEVRPEKFISTNCWGTLNLMRAYPKSRFINISSSSANEPKSIYGATKVFAETVGNMHSNCVNIRLYNVFGEGQLVESGALIPILFDAKKRNISPTLYGDGRQLRDFTYVEDAADFIVSMLNSSQTGTIHYGYGKPISVYSMAELILGESFLHHVEPLRDFEIVNSCAPKSNYPHKYGREEGLRRTTDWYESN